MKDAKHARNDVSAKPKVRGANTVESDYKQLDDRLSRLEGDMNRVLRELKQMNQATSGGAAKAQPVVKEGKPNSGSPRPGTHQSFRRSKVAGGVWSSWTCTARLCAPKNAPAARHTTRILKSSNAWFQWVG